MIEVREFRHFHVCCGLGGGARGFNRGEARVGNVTAKWRCIGGVDVDPAGLRDFERAAGVPGTLLDLFTLEQYRAFWGRDPEPGWREAPPEDFRRAAGGERPHAVFMSAPCKGNSGLLAEKASRSPKYVALNELSLRAVWLTLEAWADDPPELLIFENVPRIATRSRHLLDQIGALLRRYGYAVSETAHDCGEIGGLAQSRKRFLLVARHMAKVPNFLYEPVKHRLRGVGEVLEKLPLPGDLSAGPMHRVPALHWKTWVRLAFVEAGSDWRSLNRLRVEDGVLADYGIVPEGRWRDDILGVLPWGGTSGTVTGNAGATTGRYSVADPRAITSREGTGFLGVVDWSNHSGTVTGDARPGKGAFTIADPRCSNWSENAHRSKYRIAPWSSSAGTVTGSVQPASGGPCVADPRPPSGAHPSKYRVTAYDESAGVVIAASTTGQGAFAVADPRPAHLRDGVDAYQTSGKYGVVPWDGHTGAVAAAGQHDNGPWSVADPRQAEGDAVQGLPAPAQQLVAVIRALDGTWHRPFTTLELAALQGLVDPDERLVLDGTSDSAWRERIGNAVPPPAAAAIASVMARTLLLAGLGETFSLSAESIWVRPVAVALSVAPAALPEEW